MANSNRSGTSNDLISVFPCDQRRLGRFECAWNVISRASRQSHGTVAVVTRRGRKMNQTEAISSTQPTMIPPTQRTTNIGIFRNTASGWNAVEVAANTTLYSSHRCQGSGVRRSGATASHWIACRFRESRSRKKKTA